MSALKDPAVYAKALRTRYAKALRAANINFNDNGTSGGLRLLASAHGVKLTGKKRGPHKKKQPVRSYVDRGAMPAFGVVTSEVPLPTPQVKNAHNPVLLLPEIITNMTAGQSIHVSQEDSARARLRWKARIYRHSKRTGSAAKYVVGADPQNPGFIRIWRKA